MKKKLISVVGTAIGLMAMSSSPVAMATPNLVVNGSFELVVPCDSSHEYCLSNYSPAAYQLANNPDAPPVASNPNSSAYPNPLPGWALPDNGTALTNVLFTTAGNADAAVTSYQFANAYALFGPGNGHNNGFGLSPDGGNFVALDGDSPVTGALNQTVTGLTIGQSYSLSFWLRPPRVLAAMAPGQRP